MSLSYYADRANLFFLWHRHPDWSQAQLAQALKRSLAWVKKWLNRWREEPPADGNLHAFFSGHSRARQTPPPKTAAFVEQAILLLRDQPPAGLRRVPGAEAIQYFLRQEPALALFGFPVPSLSTIHRILLAHDRIAHHQKPHHEPIERPAPLRWWQIDFKDVSSVPPDPQGKRQHVVETLNIVDVGTSIVLGAHVHPNFTAETALAALEETLQRYGRPERITLDRDPRWVGSPMGSDFPAALVRFGACLGIQIEICAPHHPQQNGFVERYHRTYQEECLALEQPHDLAQARQVTEAFVTHYNEQRPHQGIACQNQPPRTAFPKLPALPALPLVVDPDSWLGELDGLHLVRKVDAHGMVSVDLRRYYVSVKLAGFHVTLHLDASSKRMQVLFEQRVIISLKIKGLVGALLSYDQFLTSMLHQARAQARLRSLQERKRRTT